MQYSSVFWITGLPGAGKTTFANELVDGLRKKGQSVVHLDGDQLRQVFDNHQYDKDSRINIAHQYARLAKLIAYQQQIVVVSTVSLFHQVQAWNRINIETYIEIFLNPDFNVLQARNQKGLYDDVTQSDSNLITNQGTNHVVKQSNEQGNTRSNIMGKDITPEFPISPDYEFVHKDDKQRIHDIQALIETTLSVSANKRKHDAC